MTRTDAGIIDRLVRYQGMFFLAAALCACSGGGGGGSAPASDPGGTTPTTFTVGGTLTGLAAGNSIVLRNNGGDDLHLAANGSFTFGTALANGASYAITVSAPPLGQTCSISNANGAISGGNIANVAVACQNTSGRLDATFGAGSGFALHDNAGGGNGTDAGNATAIDAAGRILVAGFSMNAAGNDDLTVWRYNADGTLDTSFNGSGFVVHQGIGGENIGVGIAIDANGRIVATGYSNDSLGNWGLAIWRYNTDGTLDTTFNGSGYVRNGATSGGGTHNAGTAVALDASGRIVVTGFTWNGADWDTALWRYNADGTLDTSFNGTGFVAHHNAAGGNGEDIGIGVAIDTSGRILVTGYSLNAAGNDDLALWRYNANGTLDTGFNGTGFAVHGGAAGGVGDDLGRSIAIDTSGRIAVTGWSRNASGNDDLAIWRYNPNGTLDNTFNGTGFVVHNSAAGGNGNEEGRAVAIDASGRLVAAGLSANAAGNTDMVMWRYNANGTLDTGFNGSGFMVHDNAAGGSGDDGGRALVLDSSGRMVVTGYSTNPAGNRDLALWRVMP